VWAVDRCNGIGGHILHRRSSTARPSWTCRRSCRRERGCFPPRPQTNRSTCKRCRGRPAHFLSPRGAERRHRGDIRGCWSTGVTSSGTRTEIVSWLHHLLSELAPGPANEAPVRQQVRACSMPFGPRRGRYDSSLANPRADHEIVGLAAGHRRCTSSAATTTTRIADGCGPGHHSRDRPTWDRAPFRVGQAALVVEQGFALLHRFAAAHPWRIRDDIHEAVLKLACSTICWRRLRTTRS
jgi:hypothetical protein